MNIDPFAQHVLDLIKASGRPPFEMLTPEVAREFYRASRLVLQPDPPTVAEMRDLGAPGPDGPIPLRLYRGAGTASGAKLPALIYYHGGGWVLGDLDSHDGVCRAIANAAGCAVVSVDYRLAPEHKFPAAVEDAVAASRFVAAQAGALGIDVMRLAVGGDSAGGNLAAVAALAARDGGGPAFCFQALIYPATDFIMDSASHRHITAGVPLTHATMVWFRDLYLRGAADAEDWRASPLRAGDLSGLPPALVVTAGLDPLADEGDAYAKRLTGSGVAVTHRRFETQIHGFLSMGRIIPASQTVIEAIAASLITAFERE